MIENAPEEDEVERFTLEGLRQSVDTRLNELGGRPEECTCLREAKLLRGVDVDSDHTASATTLVRRLRDRASSAAGSPRLAAS